MDPHQKFSIRRLILLSLIHISAKSSVKQQLVTDAIADKEKIKMDDKEYEKQLKKIADAYGYEDVKAVKDCLLYTSP